MRPLIPVGDRFAIIFALSFVSGMALFSLPSPAAAQTKYVVQPVAEMKVKQLPRGELFWRVENFPTLDQAKAAAPPYRWNPATVSYDGLPSLTAEVAGKAWLFTLGPKGGATPGGTKVAEIGPVPPLSAPEYLLRVNHGHGPPGAMTPVHMHPGSETFYVILCNRWQVGPTDPAGSDERRSGAFDERTPGRNDNGSFQQWDDRIRCADNVRRGRDQAILGTGQVRVKQFASNAIVRALMPFCAAHVRFY
jgi:hypothetical protein